MMGKMTKVLCMVAVGAVALNWGGCGIGSWQKIAQDAALSTAWEFLLDNDAVFDLFQDDFGTAATYDDRFNAPSRAEPDDATPAQWGTGPV